MSYRDRLTKRLVELRKWQAEQSPEDLLQFEAVVIDILEALSEIYSLIDRK